MSGNEALTAGGWVEGSRAGKSGGWTWRGLLAAGPYFAGLIAACLYFELALRAWALRPRLSERERVRRVNVLVRQWGTALYELTRAAFGFRLEVSGSVPPGRHVVVSNHQSTADIAILIRVLQGANCKFAVKRQLARGIPAVSTAVTRGGFGILSREGSRSDLSALKDMARGLELWDGTAVIFAEGTRSRDGRVLPYHRGAVRVVAEESGLPLLPVAIDGTSRASHLLAFPRALPERTLRLTFGAPVSVRPEDVPRAVDGIRAWAVRVVEGARP